MSKILRRAYELARPDAKTAFVRLPANLQRQASADQLRNFSISRQVEHSNVRSSNPKAHPVFASRTHWSVAGTTQHSDAPARAHMFTLEQFSRQPVPNGFLTPLEDLILIMKPTRHFERQVRRVRRLPAWLAWQGQANLEVQVLDVSRGGAKLVTDQSAMIPLRFEMAFTEGDQKRRPCEVIWRRGKMIEIRYL
jgi:hypothetical protein